LAGAGLTNSDVADLTNPSIDTVGSPEEKALLQQIVGAVNVEQTETHDVSPDMMDMLLGPMMRGTTVSFR
jgi:hypothetical protein